MDLTSDQMEALEKYVWKQKISAKEVLEINEAYKSREILPGESVYWNPDKQNPKFTLKHGPYEVIEKEGNKILLLKGRNGTIQRASEDDCILRISEAASNDGAVECAVGNASR